MAVLCGRVPFQAMFRSSATIYGLLTNWRKNSKCPETIIATTGTADTTTGNCHRRINQHHERTHSEFGLGTQRKSRRARAFARVDPLRARMQRSAMLIANR